MDACPRTVLLIAFHYPPCAVSSGVQRALSHSIHLSKYGWQPVVLSAAPFAYERTSNSQLVDIPDSVPVYRTPALDAARHLSLRGRYWSRLGLPDRWASWWLSAVPTGLRVIRRHNVSAIWSTYPLATAHRIGATLRRLSGLPWIADFRDPMVETFATGQVFPADPALRRARLSVEAAAAQYAAGLVFCTNSAREIVATRYASLLPERTTVIPNGYDEAAFRSAEIAANSKARGTRRVLLHSGTIYPGSDRGPGPLLQAIKSLAERGVLDRSNFELRLRNPSHTDSLHEMVAQLGLADLVSILGPLSYRDALTEMLGADGLLLLQGYTSNPAIPAKLYEYLRAGQPILGLVHPEGESAAALRAVGIDTMAALDDVQGITRVLYQWFTAAIDGWPRLPDRQVVASYSRENLTQRLARLLDKAVSAPAAVQRP